MEPNKFRDSRVEINRLIDAIHDMIERRTTHSLQTKFDDLCSMLDVLTPQAEGEIQERSVKNLSIKLKILNTRLEKLKTKKSTASKRNRAGIDWDEETIGGLAQVFLEKVRTNMGEDGEATVCFGTSGKGIRPNYHIHFTDGSTVSFSGSNHKPDGKSVSQTSKKMSSPFAREIIENILEGKEAK